MHGVIWLHSMWEMSVYFNNEYARTELKAMIISWIKTHPLQKWQP